MTDITKQHLEQFMLETCYAIGKILPESNSQTEITIQFKNGTVKTEFDNKQTRMEHQVLQRKLEEAIQERIEKQRTPNKGVETSKGMKEKIKNLVN